jgi:2-aminobenzoate-CoA ligase
VREGRGDRRCVSAPGGPAWTYAELQRQADRIAHVLVEDCGLVPGNRVLLRAANKPMLVACWFAVMKAGGIAVATMPMLRAKELGQIIEKAQVTIALCDVALRNELDAAAGRGAELGRVVCFGDATAADGLEARMARHDAPFANVDTAADDTCLFAFTSGTTGQPKATMHFHRDVMASCVCFPPHVLRAAPDDVFIGSPPLAFTFGLGGLTGVPDAHRRLDGVLEKAGPPDLLEAIAAHRATVCVTAPTSYRAMAAGAREKKLGVRDGGSLRKCVAAGEALPAATRALWKEATGIEIIDGIGATEMFHIFIAADEAHARPRRHRHRGAGYRARVVDDDGNDVPAGTIGRLAVQGPTGCRYLSDPRQADYVKGGWNYTGDAYLQDADGYFFYQSRTDDMIISAGYNIAAIEVEDVLLRHEAVAECAVIGQPGRGARADRQGVRRAALRHVGDEAMVKALQDFVKATVAPYKYPRRWSFGRRCRGRRRGSCRGLGCAGHERAVDVRRSARASGRDGMHSRPRAVRRDPGCRSLARREDAARPHRARHEDDGPRQHLSRRHYDGPAGVDADPRIRSQLRKPRPRIEPAAARRSERRWRPPPSLRGRYRRNGRIAEGLPRAVHAMRRGDRAEPVPGRRADRRPTGAPVD